MSPERPRATQCACSSSLARSIWCWLSLPPTRRGSWRLGWPKQTQQLLQNVRHSQRQQRQQREVEVEAEAAVERRNHQILACRHGEVVVAVQGLTMTAAVVVAHDPTRSLARRRRRLTYTLVVPSASCSLVTHSSGE